MEERYFYPRIQDAKAEEAACKEQGHSARIRRMYHPDYGPGWALHVEKKEEKQ